MWQFVVAPAAAAVLAQGLKVAQAAARGRFGWQELWSYGGMPSLHASVTSAVTATAWLYGGPSALFGVCLTFTFLTLHDALRFRRFVGEQARALNRLITKQPDEEEFRFPLLTTRTAHSLAEVLAGVGLGLVVAVLVAAWW